MRKAFFALCSVAASAAFAMPSIRPGSVQFSQDEASRRVDIAYTLDDEPAVVTVDVQTNAGESAWVSIGGRNQVTMFGDVNKLVSTIGEKSITWFPQQDWPFLASDRIRAEVTAWSVKDPPDWMVCSLVVTNMVRYYTSLDYAPVHESTNTVYLSEKLLMRKVKAAGVTWRAGAPIGDTSVGSYAPRSFPYQCMLTNDYYLGVFPITRAQVRFASVGGSGFGWNSTADPLEIDAAYGYMMVAHLAQYNDLRGSNTGDWTGWPQRGHELKPNTNTYLSRYRAITGVEMDLPTAAEWEYACRAGTTTSVYTGNDLNSVAVATEVLADVAWCQYTSNAAPYITGGRTRVALMKPNPWGFYDMLGNYMEWCLDLYHNNTSSDLQVDPHGPESNSNGKRIVRGGWANNSYQFCTAGVWYEAAPSENHTFRLRAPCEAK